MEICTQVQSSLKNGFWRWGWGWGGASEQRHSWARVELRPAGEGSSGGPGEASRSGYMLVVAGFRYHRDSWKIVFKIICSRKEKIQ